jgi:hypothetical protein
VGPAWFSDPARPGQPRGLRGGVIERLEQAEPLADFAEQQGGGGEPTAREIGDDRLGLEAGKLEGVTVTVCPGDGLALGRVWSMLVQSLHDVRQSRH